MQFDVRDFMRFIKSLDGETLRTLAREKEFNIRTVRRGLEYTPHSTGKARIQEDRFIQRVAERFADLRSFQPGDYHDITMNASYVIAIIRYYLDERSIHPDPPPC
jgi:hypothetical protein